MTKKKKAVKKRSARAKTKKQKRTKSKSRRSRSNVQFVERPAISQIEAPPGFRAVSMSQGMLEFAQPLLDYVKQGIVKKPDDAMQLAIPLWNYSISVERGDRDVDKKEVVRQIATTLRMSSKEASEFFEMMIQRKEYLLPEEIQPTSPMTMFVRKEEHYLVSEFDYDSLTVSEEAYEPDDEDKELVELLHRMDDYIEVSTEYGEWENHYFKMEKKCLERFEQWLELKGVQEYSGEFPYNAGTYLDFIYRYMHEDEVTLKTVTAIYVEEFFVDHLLRKVMAEPHEYLTWPPALKLLYRFLKEIGYLERPERIIKLLDEIEPTFVQIVKERYS
jgi:hypothetical protein